MHFWWHQLNIQSFGPLRRNSSVFLIEYKLNNQNSYYFLWFSFVESIDSGFWWEVLSSLLSSNSNVYQKKENFWQNFWLKRLIRVSIFVRHLILNIIRQSLGLCLMSFRSLPELWLRETESGVKTFTANEVKYCLDRNVPNESLCSHE